MQFATCYVFAQSAGFITAFVVRSGAQPEDIASLTGEQSRVGQQLNSYATQEFNAALL